MNYRHYDKDVRWALEQRKKTFLSKEDCLRRTRWRTRALTINSEGRRIFEAYLEARWPTPKLGRPPIDIGPNGEYIWD